jgi:hypothetical protein
MEAPKNDFDLEDEGMFMILIWGVVIHLEYYLVLKSYLNHIEI